MRKHWTENDWRQFYEQRRQSSAVWQLIHVLGSMRLAMVLLFTIPVACAVATIYESKFNSQIAQAYVYKAPWFIFWLAVLCINLFAVTLTRWPWRKKHIGFVLTHYGIILLLIGGAVGQKKGFEGSVTLHKKQGPTRQLVVNRTILQVEGGDGRARKILFPVEASRPTERKPRTLRLPDSHLKLVVDGYAEGLSENVELVESPLPNTGPGVALEFSSSMMAQTIPVALMARVAENSSHDFFGRAEIRFLEELPDRSGAKPPEGVIRESQMVFEKFAPVATTRETPENPKPSNYRLALVLDREGGEAVPHLVVQNPQGHREVFEVRQVIGRPITLHGDNTRIVVKDYWPDFELKEGQAISKSDQPNNPAVLVMLDNDGTDAKPLLELAPTPDGRLAYQMSRGGFVLQRGTAAPGGSFAVGWADWTAKINKLLPNALLRSVLHPAEKAEQGMLPGIRAHLYDPKTGQSGPSQWVPSGRGVVLRLGERTTFIGFGLEVINLPFTLQLLSFEVPRYPGTNKPSDFRSTVRFTDDQAAGESIDQLIHMNHPASYPTGFWRVTMGKSFKFSQANWNPEDLDETTLQVLYDPGWPFKWSGSLALCLGIAIMFYFNPGSSSAAKQRRRVVVRKVVSTR